LHEHDIEIVSPDFMNQRLLASGSKAITDEDQTPEPNVVANDIKPEDIIFDKADVAAEAETLRAELDGLNKIMHELTQSKKGLSKDEKKGTDIEIEMVEEQKKKITSELENIAENDEKK